MDPDRQPPPVPRKGILEPARRQVVRRRAEPPAPEPTPRKSILPYILVGLAGVFVLSVAALAPLGWTAWRHQGDVRNAGPVIAGDPPAPTAPKAGQPAAPKPASPAARPPEDDTDYTNPNPIEPDLKLKVVRFITRSEVDPVGTTRERMDVRGWPELHRDMKALMTGNVRVGGRSFDRPPSLANMIRMLDVDSEPAVLRDVDGVCTDDQLWYSVRQEGLARHQDGRWVIRITTDPTAKWEIVSRKGREVALRGIKKFPDAEAAQIVSELTYTLPAGARKVQLLAGPYRLAYEAPPPAAPATGTADPDVALKPKRVVMSALAQQYNDPTQPLWVGRCELRNTTVETLTDYRIRFRLDDYSDWGGWSVTDNIYPGQTVVDDCRPALDPKALQAVRAPTPATITAEYEYTRPTGDRVKRSTTATTKVLEMNAGVYSDVEFDPDLPWFALFKYSPEVMSAFVTGNDPVVRELADRLVAARCDGPPAGTDDEAMKYLEAAFDVLRSNVRYENAEANLIDGLVQQKLKFAREVLRGKAGTCVNTSILYASLVEAAGLEALILCKPGHAYAGAVLPKSRKFVFVETTLCGDGTPETSGPFLEACDIALKETVEAGQNKTFIKVDVNFYRKKGIAAAELPALPRTSIDDWGVRVPKMPLAGGAGKTAEPSATLDLVSREPTTRSGVKGLAFHFNVRIANAKGRKCTLMGAFFDKDHHLVRSADPKYAVPPDDILMLMVVLSPKSDDEGFRDVELFLPGDALPGGPGQHVFQFLAQVYLDEPLVKDPKFHEVKITRR